uniref:NAD(P)H-dependent oxidoreductase n=1 Tax=Lactiplantibacillus plantarum TaxID=1590 RepID=UPI003EBA5C02
MTILNNVLVIYCHPYIKSFNHAVLETVENNLDQKHKNYHVIDLYLDQFQPFYDLKELELFHTGESHDVLTKQYLSLLKHADEVVFITPIWWNGIPGMLKGFIDKVMKEGVGLSHTVTKTGIHGELTNINKAFVLTTSTSPTFYFKLFMGNGIKKIFINKTLKQLGIRKARWINFGHISNSSFKSRKKYLNEISKLDV